MGDKEMHLAADAAVAAILTDELAREDRALATVVPVLRHLLTSDSQALVSDAIVARVRGMILDLAAQLIAARAGRDPAMRMPDTQSHDTDLDAMADHLMAKDALLGHCHALAAEGLIAERLHQRHAIDPVLTPLLQELIASEDLAIATLAMSALAAQTRFMQSQRRMELPLGELPAELFHDLVAGVASESGDTAALMRLQAGYDEAAARLGLLARLFAAMRRGAVAALGLQHAGLSLFASALAAVNRQPRASVVLACHEGQGTRLALLLRASGVDGSSAERQAMLTGPTAPAMRGLAELSAAQAATLLDGGGGFG